MQNLTGEFVGDCHGKCFQNGRINGLYERIVAAPTAGACGEASSSIDHI